jgi:leucyl/phenylalanyl-tRNA--protein transferase
MGESMVSTMSNASKMAMIHLCQYLQSFDFQMIDCQVENPHLMSMGAIHIPRRQFLAELNRNIDVPTLAFKTTDF